MCPTQSTLRHCDRLFVIIVLQPLAPTPYTSFVLPQQTSAIGYAQLLTSCHREAPVLEDEALQPESRKFCPLLPSHCITLLCSSPSPRILPLLLQYAPIARSRHPPCQTTAAHTLTIAGLQLSRNKDSSKSSKKKDSKDGTASPGSTSQNSPTNTPSSSTSTLNDIRNKPLPPNSAGTNDGSAGAAGQSPLSNMTSAPGSGAFGGLGGSSQSANGAGAQQRGGLPPTVVISPSAPVRSS